MTIRVLDFVQLDKWDRRYALLANFWAEQCSKDPSTRVGTVIVGRDRRLIALGYNGFPPGIADTPERLAVKEVKYALTQHAERNALDNAMFDVAGGTLVSTFHPCSDCAKSIVSKKIARVVCPKPTTREPWATSARMAQELMQEASVDLTYFFGERWFTPQQRSGSS